ncbi:B12-binding domain-containing radical SAM protein, partial [Chlorobium sp.]|uniref:B12-binding domain-containing radical SAM protein n=1 Tax=Chlorobium sp. TaxID=1095 RepID=UPI003C58B600
KALIPLKKKWFCQATIKIADDAELLSLAVQAGCMAVYLGLESLSKNSLSEVNKSWNKPQSYIERIKKIRDAGIAIEAGIIFGFDHDSPNVFDSTAEFILKTGIESPNAHILTPYPGTPLFKRMEEQGRINTYDWNYYNTGHVVYKPKGMSEQCLMDGYKQWYKELFSVKKIVTRMKKANFPYYVLLTNIAKNHEVNRSSFKRKGIELLDIHKKNVIDYANRKEILEECYE